MMSILDKFIYISYFLLIFCLMWWGNKRIINRFYIDALKRRETK
jgi:hypothetical protein